MIAFFSIFTIVEFKLQHITNPASILVVLMIIVVSLSFAILLVIAAVERNSTLLKTWNADTKMYRLVQVGTGWYRLLQIATGYYRLLQVVRKIVQVSTGKYRLQDTTG